MNSIPKVDSLQILIIAKFIIIMGNYIDLVGKFLK